MEHEQMLNTFWLTNIIFNIPMGINIAFSGKFETTPTHKLHKEMLAELESDNPNNIEIYRLLDEIVLEYAKYKK